MSGAGIERLVIALEEEGVEEPPAPAMDVFLAVEADAPRDRVAAPPTRGARSGTRRSRAAGSRGEAR